MRRESDSRIQSERTHKRLEGGEGMEFPVRSHSLPGLEFFIPTRDPYKGFIEENSLHHHIYLSFPVKQVELKSK